MAHYAVFTPGPEFSLDPDDWCWDGTWEWVCEADTTEPCRWTCDCDCEVWQGLVIAPDGSWATHVHYDDDDNEVAVQMTVDGCGIAPWFHEDYPDSMMPPRPGRNRVRIVWDYDYYTFEYAESAGE